MDSLVSTSWLASELGSADLRIVDATYFLGGSGRDPRADYEAAHIPGAMFLDLPELADKDSPLPNMRPPAHKFASRMQSLGIGDGSRVVTYDNSPLRTAARAWWLLRSFGAQRVAILDGGFAKWQAEGRPVESGRPQVRHGHFTPLSDQQAVADKAFMLANLEQRPHQILDARSAERFAGGGPDAHGVAGGHIPGSANLPYGRLFNADGTYKKGEALRAEFDAAGVDLDRPLVTTCGSGVTACVLLFGAHLLGREGVKLYDGSWSEWGADPNTPKAIQSP
ncbi:MAG TPA: sulfurtransferase [Allosphingosinicella sp.]|jgi:thiosulfate/3-mercaptopyruvate sulfurtransferase